MLHGERQITSFRLKQQIDPEHTVQTAYAAPPSSLFFGVFK